MFKNNIKEDDIKPLIKTKENINKFKLDINDGKKPLTKKNKYELLKKKMKKGTFQISK